MLLMGCLIGGIILVMYLPIFSMSDLFLPWHLTALSRHLPSS